MHQDIEEKKVYGYELKEQLDQKIKTVANALLDKQTRREAAYAAAELYFKVYSLRMNPNEGFDFEVSDVIFHWTHYDVCSNGFFYRMS